MKLKKIISGGQTGADQGGLIAAALRQIKTGGHAPHGYKTLEGTNYRLKAVFGLEEHPSPSYPPRTDANVKNSDATIRFAVKFNSPGEKCTLRAIRSHKKPYLDIDIENPLSPVEVADWIISNNVEVLNIAGNSEKTYLGMERFVVGFLLKVFDELK
jgi:hypothetical protein